MGWIEKPRQERIADVRALNERCRTESPDRFWVSDEQDGPDKQIMHILLPAEEDVYFDITMMTAQLHAARLVAYDLGQRPGEVLAITPRLLDAVGVVREEIFQLDHQHEAGIGLTIVLDAPGLTHSIIDTVLGSFLDSGQLPLKMNPVDPQVLIERLIRAREDKKQNCYPL